MLVPASRRRLRLFVVLISALLTASAAFPVTDEEIFRNFRFNFQNPGARALAMGGAFIAIADDATAAQANPARLAGLGSPQLFVEWRTRDSVIDPNNHTKVPSIGG